MKMVSIQSLLSRLVWLSLLPVLLLVAYLVKMQVDTAHIEITEVAGHRARNAALLIDNFLDGQISGLKTLTHSPLLSQPVRLDEFYQVAHGFRDSFGGHVIVADRTMQMLLNTRAPQGAKLPLIPVPRAGGQAAAPTALDTAQPAVGDIVDGPVAHQPLLAVAVPVIRDSEVSLLLLSTMETSQLGALLGRISLPEGWALTLLDGKDEEIARQQKRPLVRPDLGAIDTVLAPVTATGGRWKVRLEVESGIGHAAMNKVITVLVLALFAALLAGLLAGRSARDAVSRALTSLARNEPGNSSGAIQITEVEAVRGQLLAGAQALRASETRYKELFAANPQPMWFYDLQTLRFLAVNAAAIQHYGYSEAEFLAMTTADIRPPEDVPRLQENVARIREASGSGPDRAGVWRHRRRDGSIISVEITSHVLDYKGRRAEVVLANDVTERLRTEERVAEYVMRLERAMTGTAEAIAQIMDLRDPYTAGHERRVGEIAAAIAWEMGLSESIQRGLRVAGDLHDLGKITVPVEILAKPGKLSVNEFELIKQHPQKGYEVLKGIDFPWPVAEVAYQHHERIDGSGYPRGLKGDEILLEARILAVADVVEAMSSHRPYRAGLGLDKAMAEIEAHAGRQYDAAVVAACLRMFRQNGYRMPE